MISGLSTSSLSGGRGVITGDLFSVIPETLFVDVSLV